MPGHQRIGEEGAETLPAEGRRQALALLSCELCGATLETVCQTLMEGGIDLFELRCRECGAPREVRFDAGLGHPAGETSSLLRGGEGRLR